MKTVVQFIKNRNPGDGNRNKVFSRTLRKVAFIDGRWNGEQPRAGEHWLVDIARENQNQSGGCFVLHPLEKIEREDLVPLVHGMYDMANDGDAIILSPKESGKYWVMSPKSKALLLWGTMRSVVISHGGPMWSRRKPAEDVMESEAKNLLESLDD